MDPGLTCIASQNVSTSGLLLNGENMPASIYILSQGDRLQLPSGQDLTYVHTGEDASLAGASSQDVVSAAYRAMFRRRVVLIIFPAGRSATGS